MCQAGVSDAVARVLAARGIDAMAAANFLSPTLKVSLPDPSLLVDMDQAAARLVAAIKAKEPIAVFGDYDVDGATSSALLMRFFRSVGVPITVYIPDRRIEGYGPNTPALLKLRGQGVKVIVTVDCGIVAFEALTAAKDAGLDVIVVDHHKAEVGLPAVDTGAWYGIVAPAGTPKDILGRLASEVGNVVNSPDLKEKLATQGMKPLTSTPDGFAALINADMAKYARLIKAANIKLDD